MCDVCILPYRRRCRRRRRSHYITFCQGPPSFMYEIVLICWLYYYFPCCCCCFFFFVFSSSRLSVRLFYYYGSLTSLDFTRLQNTKFLFFGRPFATLAAFRFSETNEFAFFYHFNYQIINMLACARCNKLCGTDVSRTDSSTLRATSRFVSKTKTKCAKIVTLIFIRNPNAHKKYGRSIREYPHLAYTFMRL